MSSRVTLTGGRMIRVLQAREGRAVVRLEACGCVVRGGEEVVVDARLIFMMKVVGHLAQPVLDIAGPAGACMMVPGRSASGRQNVVSLTQ